MNWEEVGKAVARSAPALGGVLGGPGGAAIGSVIASVFGVEGSPDAVAEAIKIDPQAAVKLREIERDERMGILQIRAKQAQMEADDRASARARDTDIQKVRGYNPRADILAFLAVTGLVLCVYFVAADTAMPERAVNAIMFVAGVLAAAVRDVYHFEFGSSKGSKEKDSVIDALHVRNGGAEK